MRENLNYYLALPSVVKGDVVDLEAKVQKTFIHDNNRALKLILTHLKKAWTKPYVAGQAAYVDEDWAVMVETMEESLRLYLKSV